ncbi:hypothetical protein [Croceimicrobium sp.]|uniref:hypothetical protein n=1 Tax=Croceimicrobium sp. TaxID=2828340 RepID=UPI003BA9E97E
MMRLCLFLLLSSMAFAQSTGSFHQDHTFNSSDFSNLNRRFSFYVPATYQASQNHTLILALPGCGVAPNDFRDDLRTIADSLDAIVACLDAGGNAITDEYGGREVKLLEYLYDSVQAHYTIDPNAVYLTGFSCNGREAMRVVLEELTTVPFAGVIPYSGAFNHPNFNPPSFARSQVSPVCLCMGTRDYFYTQLPYYHDLIDSLQARQAQFHEILMPNVGHTTLHPRFDEYMLDCFEYLSNTTSIGLKEDSSQEAPFQYRRQGEKEVWVYSNSPGKARAKILSLDGKTLFDVLFQDEQSFSLPQKGIYILQLSNTQGQQYEVKLAL